MIRIYRVEIAAYPAPGMGRHTGPYVRVWHVRADSVENAQGKAFRAMEEPLSTWQYARTTGALRKSRVWLSKTDVSLIQTKSTH